MKILRSLFVAAVATAVVTGVNTTATEAQSADALTCSAYGANSLTVHNELNLLSHDEGGAFIGPLDIDVPAGTYTVTGVSYDEHSAKPGQEDQINETWYVEGYKDGELVYTSGTTDDLPSDLDYNSTVIGSDVAIPELDSIRFAHAAFPDPLYESVVPSCVNFSEAQVQAVATCEITDGMITIEQSQVLLSHDEGGAFIGPIDVTIEAGTYDISAVSFDNHSTDHNDPTQTLEQWYFEGYANGELVYTSNTTDDLPDDQDYITSDLGKAELPAIDQIRYVHAGYPDAGYHSVYPSCINLTLDDSGNVLGDVDDKNTGGDDGNVLGTGDTLAATGASTVIASTLGGVIGFTGIALTKLSRREN